MTSLPEYTFRMERTSWKSQNLICEEPGHQLSVYLELSGVEEFDWVGADTDFGTWTIPAGEPIPPIKQQEILARLAEWAAANEIRLDIGPPVSMEEVYAEYRRQGFTVERQENGSTLISPPPSKQAL